MENPLISIVMVNYNHEDFLGEAISSVIRQTYQNWELIIVDDGSTDESCNIIAGYPDSRIKPIYLKENGHICAATNIGLKEVKGEYIARLDSDDVWREDKLEKQVQLMQERTDIGLCFTKLEIIDQYSKVVPREEAQDLYNLYDNRQKSRGDWLKFFFFYGNSLIQSSLLMKSEVVEKIGMFNLAYVQTHDFDFFVRAVKHYEFGFIEEPLLKYRRNHNQNSAINSDNNLRFFNEHMSIRYHFFDDFPDGLFQETFQDCFVDKDAASHEELLCEQAFLLMKCVGQDNMNPVLGLMKMEEYMKDPDMRKILAENYQFTPKSFYKENTKHQFYSYELHREMQELERRVKEQTEKSKHQDAHIALLLEVKNQQQKQIEEMANSTSWKMTKPMRKIGDAVKQKIRREEVKERR